MSEKSNKMIFTTGIIEQAALDAITKNNGYTVIIAARIIVVCVSVQSALLSGTMARYTLPDGTTLMLAHTLELEKTVLSIL